MMAPMYNSNVILANSDIVLVFLISILKFSVFYIHINKLGSELNFQAFQLKPLDSFFYLYRNTLSTLAIEKFTISSKVLQDKYV